MLTPDHLVSRCPCEEIVCKVVRGEACARERARATQRALWRKVGSKLALCNTLKNLQLSGQRLELEVPRGDPTRLFAHIARDRPTSRCSVTLPHTMLYTHALPVMSDAPGAPLALTIATGHHSVNAVALAGAATLASSSPLKCSCQCTQTVGGLSSVITLPAASCSSISYSAIAFSMDAILTESSVFASFMKKLREARHTRVSAQRSDERGDSSGVHGEAGRQRRNHTASNDEGPGRFLHSHRLARFGQRSHRQKHLRWQKHLCHRAVPRRGQCP